ncbi:MAG: class I SAM-dependent methyltransferase [Armatimonadetes bacterium]|nr:class I SAM-dependent methyltransferase [Armatimonadota bacterium]
MSEKISRFDGKASIYASSRPTYPLKTLHQISEVTDLPTDATVYDLGAGTGLFSQILLEHFQRVHLVEPNADMRGQAENVLPTDHSTSIDAEAESFPAEPRSIDLITAAQAFHWFDQPRAKAHWRQVLKPSGWVALVWNTRIPSTPFAEEVGNLLKALVDASPQGDIPQDSADEEILAFFESAQILATEHTTPLSEQELCNLVMSRSYSPRSGEPLFAEIKEKVQDIHASYQSNGLVDLPYLTKLYIGRI